MSAPNGQCVAHEELKHQPIADPKLLLQILHRRATWIQIFERFEVDDRLHQNYAIDALLLLR